MQLLGDVQKSLARGDLAITDPAALRELVRLEPGMTVRGRVAGTTSNELGEAPFLVLEATDGRVLLIPQTPAMEERRGEGGLRRGHVVTLLEHESVREGRRVRWTEIQEHGRLRDLVRTRELATVLDLEVMERSRAACSLGGPGAFARLRPRLGAGARGATRAPRRGRPPGPGWPRERTRRRGGLGGRPAGGVADRAPGEAARPQRALLRGGRDALREAPRAGKPEHRSSRGDARRLCPRRTGAAFPWP